LGCAGAQAMLVPSRGTGMAVSETTKLLTLIPGTSSTVGCEVLREW
jgi:hypothetical protein